MSTIDFIGGEKGGVGKSVLAQLVVQYAIDRSGVGFRAAVNDPTVGADTFTRMDRHRIKVWLQATQDRSAPVFAFAD
jgi:hypothetical protein